MLRVLVFFVACFFVTDSVKAETLVLNSDKNTLVCRSEKGLADILEVIVKKSVAEAELAYRNPNSFGCFWINARIMDVTQDTHQTRKVDELVGYTHLVYVTYKKTCTFDGIDLGQCYMLLLRSVLFDIHDDFFNVAIGYRRVGAVNKLFNLFK